MGPLYTWAQYTPTGRSFPHTVQCAPVSILPKKGDVRKYAYLDILLAYSEFCTLGWFNTADRMWTGRKVHSKYGHSATGNFPFLSHSGIFQPTLWPNYLKEPASMFAATLNQYSMRTATVLQSSSVVCQL